MQNENGVLAVQEDFGNALVDKYVPIWDKKYRSKGESIWVFQRRILSSACQVATTLHDMDFGKASTFLFHLVREAEECKPIIEAVSSQVELAMANPDKFIKGYHQFLQGLTKPIKKIRTMLCISMLLLMQRNVFIQDYPLTEMWNVMILSCTR